MRWQKTARLAIAAFVIGFATLVFVAMRRTSVPKHVAAGPKIDTNAVAQTSGPAVYDHHKDGKLAFSLRSVGQKTYPDGRSVFEHVTLTLPDKDGRTITVVADEGELLAPPDATNQLSTANLKKNVRLTTSDDLTVLTDAASYIDKEGVLKVPGVVTFTRGRLSGKGVGATYDRNADVLWILDQAQVFVAPDPTGAGKIEASAATAGIARAEHYFRLSRTAHVVSDNRTIDADDITAQLTPDNQNITTMQLRGNSRITGTGAGAQTMSAKDIDLTYAEDGRTLQRSRLMEQAVVQLPVDGGASRQIAARTIDMGMSADGTAVTQLNANESVVLDLPGQADIPAKQIRATSLVASSTSGAGLETATFEGPVDYHETRPASGQTAAVDRKARSARLIVQTKPGLGDLQQADFRGNVKIIDGQTTAEAPRALYQVTKDRMDLSPSETGDPGLPPTVSDPQITVQARTIQLTMSTHAMIADTNVRSILQRKAGGGRGSDQTRLPSMLKQDEPVTVTANHLEYDSVASHAVYSGDARLSQVGGTEIRAQDTIDLDDKTGNLTARVNVRTKMVIEDVDPKTKARSSKDTNGTADTLVYDDAKRLAVYTTGPSAKAHIVGPLGDLTGERVELYLKQGGNELERAEAYAGSEPVVVIQELRTAKGNHLTYTAADDTYVMTGTPVDVLEHQTTGCKRTLAATVTFNRTDDRVRTAGGPGVRGKSETVECPERR